MPARSTTPTRPRTWQCYLGILTFMGLAELPARGDIIFDIATNTSSINGTVGYLDFQFNPGVPPPPPGGAQSATATVSQFTDTGGTIGAIFLPNIGDVSGALPGVLTLNNTDPVNELTQGFTFGTDFSFRVTFSGDAVSFPNNGLFGSTFVLTMFDQDFNPLLTTDFITGAALQIQLLPDATVTVSNSSAGGAVTATFIPEPSGYALWLFAGTILSGAWRIVGMRWRRVTM